MSLNKVMLIGNVGKDPDVRYLEGNAKVASFTLATTERYKDRNGELRENTEWHNLVAWRSNADVIERFVHKGTQIYVEGRLRTRNYVDQTGVKKYVTEIQVDNLQLLGKKSDNDAAAPQGYAPAAPQQSYQAPAQTYQAPAQQSYTPPVQQPAAPAYSEPASYDDNGGVDDLPF